MSEGAETIIADAVKPTKAQLLKSYLDELNVDVKVFQVFEDGRFVGQEIRIFDRPTPKSISAPETIDMPTGSE